MSAENTEATATEADKQGEFTPITNQAELDKAIGPRLERERAKFADYKELKAKADKFDELEAANKTEIERAQSERDTAKAELDRERLEIKRLQLANEHGISGEYLELFTGSSIEDLEAKAPKIAALIPAQTDTTDTGIRELVVTAEGKSPAALASDPLAAMLTQAVS
jgi:hypothetical protein